MRWSLLLLLVAIPTLAFAEPKVAVAPLDGDPEGTMGDVVAEAAGERAKVTKQGRTEGAMRSLGVSVLSPKSLRKLRTKLDVDVVIYGSVEKDGGAKRLSLQLSGNGKSKLDIEYKSTKQLSKELAAKLPKRIAAAMEGDGGNDEDEEDARAKRDEEERRKKKDEEEARKREEEARAKREEDDRRRKKEEEDRRKQDEEEKRAERKRKDDDDRRKKRRGDDEDEERDDRRASKKKRDSERNAFGEDEDEDEDEDGDRRKKRVADRGDETEDERTDEVDEERPRKKRKRGKRHVLTQAAVWLDAGAAFARRTLTYTSTGMMRPPPVGTAAPAARIEGEVYPAAFSSLQGPVAGIGVVGAYSRTFALGIAVPGTQIVTPISSGHYSIGARYRFVFGQHAVAAGISYWRSHYIADRTKLMNPDQLDMPDVDYSAIAPGIAARIGVTPIVSAFATVDVPLVLKSGPIQDPTNYGGAKIIAFDLRGGAQVVLASHVALQVGIDFEQVGLSFTGQPGSKASTRMVSKATDRSVGIGATLGINY